MIQFFLFTALLSVQFVEDTVANTYTYEAPQEIILEHQTVTAYSELDSCHYENCAMASGKRAYVGAVACPRSIKLSTTVLIDGTPFVCEDRTSEKHDGVFDIFMGYGLVSYEKAITFGRQKKQVQILQEDLWSQAEHTQKTGF